MPIKGLDKYLDPPDEPEAEFCESCGHEMEEIDNFGEGGRDMKCTNLLCPDKHTGAAKALAEHIVELEDIIERQKSKTKRLEWQVTELTKAFEEK